MQKNEAQNLEKQREILRKNFERKEELVTIQAQLRNLAEILELQKIMIGEYAFRLYRRDLKRMKNEFERIQNCLDTVICLLSDIVIEIDSEFEE
jgi:hypothetical protein